MDLSTEHQEILVVLEEIISNIMLFLTEFYRAYRARVCQRSRVQRVRHVTYSLKFKIPKQIEHLQDLISYNNQTCIDNFRMCRNAFARLCFLTEHVGGFVATKNVKINEQVAIFLIILSHHTKNRIVKCNFKRSGYTISKHFNKVLEAILKLRTLLLANPQPIPEDWTDERWKWFKGCLGALDGTYIPIKVPQVDKTRYRNRKGHIAVNVLGVCDRDMKFQYVLTGWEGSASDSWEGPL
ncbi:hypothetical protein BUALT_Bualt06G0078200 [Buddleja alternifolia]|uniref:DDE Tnp4 domain-containing protein n=1 Tax=Buddleja alternifolia TaxID=168488 RepID=A0AAV6XDJ9_9LAMI|nr:hypothetical protein BUALT_Bualt06G0078200 [Buddleja alternifolia]